MGNIPIEKNPEFKTDMEAMTIKTRAHADEFNPRYEQLLNNDEFLKKQIGSIKPLTYEDIDDIEKIATELHDYEGDVTDDDIDNILKN